MTVVVGVNKMQSHEPRWGRSMWKIKCNHHHQLVISLANEWERKKDIRSNMTDVCINLIKLINSRLNWFFVIIKVKSQTVGAFFSVYPSELFIYVCIWIYAKNNWTSEIEIKSWFGCEYLFYRYRFVNPDFITNFSFHSIFCSH